MEWIRRNNQRVDLRRLQLRKYTGTADSLEYSSGKL